MRKFEMSGLRHRMAVMAIAPLVLAAGGIGVLTGPASATSTAFTNGSFEFGSYTAPASQGYQTLYPGDTSLTGWTVVSGSVDWINGYWTSEDGSKSIDMNGTPNASNTSTVGTIEQSFSTLPGASYTVSFWLAGNPDGGPSVKSLSVNATGGTLQSYSFDTSSTSNTDMGWVPETYTFIATSSSATLTFSADSSNTSNNGAALDNVSVTGAPTAGAQCKNGGWQVLSNPTTGVAFTNQGQCVSYLATNGDVPIGS
jgi:choice-of-anchor C domain-containing protein